MNAARIALVTWLAVGAAGCAATPAQQAAAQPVASCQQLAAATAEAEGQRVGATAQAQSTWKAVVPVAVAAKYAGARADVRAAEERLVILGAESARLGCARAGG